MIIHVDFKELLRLLEKHDVDYMIVGDMLLPSMDIPDLRKISIFSID